MVTLGIDQSGVSVLSDARALPAPSVPFLQQKTRPLPQFLHYRPHDQMASAAVQVDRKIEQGQSGNNHVDSSQPCMHAELPIYFEAEFKVITTTYI